VDDDDHLRVALGSPDVVVADAALPLDVPEAVVDALPGVEVGDAMVDEGDCGRCVSFSAVGEWRL